MRRSPVRPLLVTLALFSSAVALPAASRADFDRVVDFSVTLKTLAAAADGTEPMPAGRMLVLSGTVSAVTIVNKEEATFRVRIEIITGEWVGLEDVKSYASFVDYAGQEFFAVFPARAPAKPGPDIVVQGSRVLVVARAAGVTTTPLGEKRTLLEGAYIRAIP
jgi:hypothetical protein